MNVQYAEVEHLEGTIDVGKKIRWKEKDGTENMGVLQEIRREGNNPIEAFARRTRNGELVAIKFQKRRRSGGRKA